MIQRVFTIYDSKSEAYLQPFFMLTDGQARRAIEDCVNDPGHQFGRHPEDYTLFFLGTWDDSTCAWDLGSTAIAMCKCLELVRADVQAVPLKAVSS